MLLQDAAWGSMQEPLAAVQREESVLLQQPALG